MHTEKRFVEDDIICKDLCFSLCDVHIRFPTCSIMSFLLLCLAILKTKCCPCKVRLGALKIDAFQLCTGMDSLAQQKTSFLKRNFIMKSPSFSYICKASQVYHEVLIKDLFCMCVCLKSTGIVICFIQGKKTGGNTVAQLENGGCPLATTGKSRVSFRKVRLTAGLRVLDCCVGDFTAVVKIGQLHRLKQKSLTSRPQRSQAVWALDGTGVSEMWGRIPGLGERKQEIDSCESQQCKCPPHKAIILLYK